MRRKRAALAALALAALAVSAGCLAFFTGGGTISDDTLDEEPPQPYAWNGSVGVHITLTDDAKFLGVYRINDSMSLYRDDGFGGENPIPVSAVRFRYPNGTVVNGSTYRARGGQVEKTRDAVEVGLPNDTARGRFAFTSESTPKRFTLPTFVTGVSYEVVLPPERRVELFPFGNIAPGGSEVRTVGERRVVHWDEVTGGRILVQFYLQRDLYIFGGLVAVLSVVGVLGAFYYRRKIERLRRRRQDLGTDVELDDDDDGPPPGMG